ncbi:hypothetical protein [Streptomyces sp. NPDC058653]|uniref:hypothetical protein n=1 Tax=Streptomyces sp. NPDC058653 TaxID=3346576 RepID=UPI00365EADE4
MSARPVPATPDDTNPSGLTPEREQEIRDRRDEAVDVSALASWPLSEYRLIKQTLIDMALLLAELDRVRAELAKAIEHRATGNPIGGAR